jgi:hypothetical protein
MLTTYRNKVGRKSKGALMSTDAMLITFSSLGFASVFLALIIGLADRDATKIVSAVAGMSPSARKAARIEQLEELTRIADQAIEARQSGKLFTASDAGM